MIAYFCGEWLESASIKIPLNDFGFTMGVTVTERFRTYAGEPLFVDQHLNRFRDGLKIVGIELEEVNQLASLVEQVVQRNRSSFELDDDLEISMFATPGTPGKFPTLGIVPALARFDRWASKYESGESLTIVSVQETDKTSWPKNLKCRSRMHYWLAEQESERVNPGSKPLLLDHHGNLAETSTGLFAAIVDGKIIAPPEDKVLPSISFTNATAILQTMDFQVSRQPMPPSLLKNASEALLFSSPNFVLPVVQVDGDAIGNGNPGAVFSDLIDRFSKQVGLNLVGQSKRMAIRESG